MAYYIPEIYKKLMTSHVNGEKVLISSAEANDILAFFGGGKADTQVLDNTPEYRAYLQAMMMSAIDMSSDIGLFRAILSANLPLSTSMASLAKKVTNIIFQHYYKKYKSAQNCKIVESCARNAIKLGHGTAMGIIVNDLGADLFL